MVMLLFGLSALPAQGAAPAPALLQPSPRPAIDPLHRLNAGAGVEAGHITGTIIDLNTGAPIAGVPVDVGGDIVTSDANGNYDHWLPVGTYSVSLALPAAQGTPAQGTVMVSVDPNVATVQHLNFRSPPAAEAAPVAAPAADIAPVGAPAPQAAKPPAAPKAKAKAPNRLPHTGSDGYGGWTWLVFGMALLMAGGLVGFGPVMNGRSAAMILRAQAVNVALLHGLLAAPVRPAPRPATEQNDLLAALLGLDR
jgi:hypothetical protein